MMMKKCYIVSGFNPIIKDKYDGFLVGVDKGCLYLALIIDRKSTRLNSRDKKTKSFGNTVSGFEFKIRKEEFDSTFDGIIKTMLDNLEKYQS